MDTLKELADALNNDPNFATNGGVSKSVSVVQNGKAIYITKESDPNVGAEATTCLLYTSVYKPDGDTQVAQAKDEALVFLVILKRDRDTVVNFIEQ